MCKAPVGLGANLNLVMNTSYFLVYIEKKQEFCAELADLQKKFSITVTKSD
jgi:hypothetical protein